MNFEGLDEPFRELLDAESLQVTLPPLAFEPTPGLDMKTEWILRAPGAPTPTTATGFAEDIGGLVHEEVLARGVDSLWVFSFHGAVLEWWRLQGHLPCSVDDVLRNIAQFSKAEAVALVLAGSVQLPDGETKRAIQTLVEFAGRRAHRALVLDFAPDGSAIPLGILRRDEVAVPSTAGWLGVVPKHDLQIRTNEVIRAGPGPAFGES